MKKLTGFKAKNIIKFGMSLFVAIGLSACADGQNTKSKQAQTYHNYCNHNKDTRISSVAEIKNLKIDKNLLEAPLVVKKLTKDKLGFACIYGGNSISVALANGEPYTIELDEKKLEYPDGWNTKNKVLDLIFSGQTMYIVDDKKNLTNYHAHGDHFHFGKSLSLASLNLSNNLKFIKNANTNKLYLFDAESKKLFIYKKGADKKYNFFVAENLIKELQKTSFVIENISWFGKSVETYFATGNSEEEQTIKQGYFLITGEDKSKKNKAIILSAEGLESSNKNLIVKSIDLNSKVRQLLTSPKYKYAILISDYKKDLKDNIKFIDSGLEFESNTASKKAPSLLEYSLNKENALGLNYLTNGDLAGLLFAGNDEKNASFTIFKEENIKNKSINFTEIKDKKNFKGLVMPLVNQRALVVGDDFLATYNLNKKQLEHSLKVPCLNVKGAHHLGGKNLISCADGVLEVTTEFSEIEKKTISLNQLNMDKNLIEALLYTDSSVEFPFADPSESNLIEYLAGVKSLQFNVEKAKNPLSLSGIKYLKNISSLNLYGKHKSCEADDHEHEHEHEHQNCTVDDLILTESDFIKFSKLTSFTLSETATKKFDFLSGLTNLTSLYLAGQSLTNIDFLDKHQNLHSLGLTNNNLSDISKIAKLTKLKILELGNNKISDFEVIKNLINLEKLDLQANGFSNLPNLTKNINLKEVYLMENKLTSLQNLSGLLNLETLRVVNNNITDISNFINVPKLKELDLASNKISGELSKKRIDELLKQKIQITIYKNPIRDIYKKDVLNGG